MPLRSEVYALDGEGDESHPFLVSGRAYRVDLIQPRRETAYAVFRTCQSEAIDYHYDRNPADPRIGHQLNLEVDEFGHVTKSAALAYPRRSPGFPEQATALITAIHANKPAAVALLLERGADVHVRDARGFTPLHFAAQGGHEELVRQLLARGADRHALAEGVDPLTVAQRAGHAAVVALLQALS